MVRVATVVGTRPEAIKLAPVVRAIADRTGLKQQIIMTGQHRGLETSFSMIGDCERIDLALDAAHLSAGELCETIEHALCRQIARSRPDMVVVQGDTTSALAAALAARECGVPLAHVEAGLRSFDLDHPWPEEGNRIRIDALSALLFAPTDRAADNLAADSQVRGKVLVTGNTGIDALLGVRGAVASRAFDSRRRILVTCHRRENRGERLRDICGALATLVECLPVTITLPLHPNPHVRDLVERRLGGIAHIDLIEAVGHREMVRMIAQSWILLTDSGGLQEEGAALGRPVLVLREVTERPEAAANLELVGTSPERIVGAVARLLGDEARYARMAAPSLAFGDGRAAERIVDAIEAYFAQRRCPAPA